jgi:hypothetical protein
LKWSVGEHYPSIYLQKLRKTIKPLVRIANVKTHTQTTDFLIAKQE